ncbi:AraC family transcriptional regulator [bacterium]|nr:MAG: AraC family transcriptional regulator [bacterium]
MDKLTALLTRFSMSAGVFYAGEICGAHVFHEDVAQGHIHLIKRGPVRLIGVGEQDVQIAEPTVMFLPRPDKHRLVADDTVGAHVVCGTVRLGGGARNPITDSLPTLVLIKLVDLPGAAALLDLIFEEAFSGQCGRQAALDRLCEVLMIRLLRYCIDRGLTQGGTLAGLADRRIAKALIAIHDDAARQWQLADLAALAGMSRARFAVQFREITGETPVDYLASWRLMSAQTLLKRGVPIKHIAGDVGYGSASALTRAFVRKFGCSPREWLKLEQGAGPLSKPDTRG